MNLGDIRFEQKGNWTVKVSRYPWPRFLPGDEAAIVGPDAKLLNITASLRNRFFMKGQNWHVWGEDGRVNVRRIT